MHEVVSVVIPVYNALPYLEECLLSVSGQTYRHLEIIIINDGSSDESGNVIANIAATDPRIRLHEQENQGLGFTRNKGIDLSTGKYIFFLDADDILPKNAIQSLLAAVKHKDVDYAVGKVVRFTNDRMYIPVRHLEFNLYNKSGQTTLEETPELMQDSIACNKLWKKSFLLEHNLNFKEGKYYEDLAMTMKAAVLARKIQLVNTVVYHWRVREDIEKPSITQQQMRLDNTRHRLEALFENRQWLVERQIQKRIVEEHDLKSLLDVMRLHVVKFSLILPEEKNRWLMLIFDFLKKIPAAIADKLPNKERTMYWLLMEKNTEDLFRLSELLMNAEKTAVVSQKQNLFVLKSMHKDYDVTTYFKPTMVVQKIEKHNQYWRVEGQLKVPKASYLTEGEFYLLNRTTRHEKVLAPLQLRQLAPAHWYPYEALYFIGFLDTETIIENEQEAVYDFYYRLPAYPQMESARVRVLSQAVSEKKEAKKNNFTFSLYRTQYGNLSLVCQKLHLMHVIKEKVRPLLKKAVQKGKAN